MKNRPSFEAFKEKALKISEVKAQYDELEPIFTLKKQMIQARLEAKLSQEDIANFLHTKKSNISRLESLNAKSLPNLSTLIEYARAIGFNLEINLKKSSMAS